MVFEAMQRFRRSSLKTNMMNTSNEAKKTFKSYVDHFKSDEVGSRPESTTEMSPIRPPRSSLSKSRESFFSSPSSKSIKSSANEKDGQTSSSTPPHGNYRRDMHGTRSFISSSAATLSRLALSPVKNSFTLPFNESESESDVSLTHTSLRRQSSFTCFNDFRENESILTRPIDSVKRYNLHMNRSKGTIGQLFLTNRRLKFINYHADVEADLDRRKSGVLDGTFTEEKTNIFDLRLPPFDIHPLSSEECREIHEQDIDLINIYQIRNEQETQDTHLTVMCNDFRSIEFQMKTSDLVRNLIEKLEQMIAEPRTLLIASSSQTSLSQIAKSVALETPLLWTTLYRDYPFDNPQDWQKEEGYWFAENPALRITQCNENHNMCSSLPESFITMSNYLSDITLVHTISPHTNGNRVPVITYCYNHSKAGPKLLLRCSAFKIDVTNIFYDAIRPLNIVEVSSVLPPLSKVESAYNKLRKSCSLYADAYPHFLSHTGKWLRIVSRILTTAKQMARLITEESSSLILMEENDDHFNPILSSLIQLSIDPRRRTISGFQNLLSKEWIYLNGVSPGIRSPDPILFTLFLDSVWQLICKNPNHFEFSSLYLIRLYDLQTIPAGSEDAASCSTERFMHTVSSPLPKSTSTTVVNHQLPIYTELHQQTSHPHVEPSSLHDDKKRPDLSKSLSDLNVTQIMFLHNPFYRGDNSITSSEPCWRQNHRSQNIDDGLRIICDLFLLDLWRPLFLRWIPIDNHRNYYNCFPLTEFVYYDFLLSNLDQSPLCKLEASDEDLIESYL